jgi:transcriptional regulator GlxA family with amidase domain
MSLASNMSRQGYSKVNQSFEWRDSLMLRTSNEEDSVRVPRQFAPDLRIQLFNVNSTNRANQTKLVAYMRGGLPPKLVRRLREHIDSNIDKRISVEALAKLANLSVCYFTRAFKQSVGVTPHDYVIRRRVGRAMELLSGTNMPLSQIALAAGFADQSHSARRFRQVVGMSPREYRWSMR